MLNAYELRQGTQVKCTSGFSGSNYSSFDQGETYIFMGLDSEDDVQLGKESYGRVSRVGDCTPAEFSEHFRPG